MTTPRHPALAFSGSLRAASANTGLVRMAQRLAPDGLDVIVFDRLAELPFYNPDLETDPPEAVSAWRAAVTAAEALIIGLPEYNFGPPALLKNAIDWASRPMGGQALKGKHVVLLTSGGKGGGSRVQEGVAQLFGLFGNTVVVDPVVQIALGLERISADGSTSDPAIESLVAEKLRALITSLDAS